MCSTEGDTLLNRPNNGMADTESGSDLATGKSAGPVSDLDAFARLLASHDSATRALHEWCRARGIADPAIIRVEHTGKGEEAAVPAATLRTLLEIDEAEPLGYRHVRLLCGDITMSVAHNFYVPCRLTKAMNATLDMSDTPFGIAVEALRFTRERLDPVEGATPGCPGDTVLSQSALLRRTDRQPISLVIECYTPAILAPPVPR